jgi:hypothetical protein
MHNQEHHKFLQVWTARFFLLLHYCARPILNTPEKLYYPGMDRSPDIISLLFSFDLWNPIIWFGTRDNANLVMLFLKTNFHKLPTSLIFPLSAKKKKNLLWYYHQSVQLYEWCIHTYVHTCMHTYIHTYIIITCSTSLICSFIVHVKPINIFLEIVM